MRHSRKNNARKGMGALAAAGTVLGVPTGLLVLGALAAAGLAWANSGSNAPDTANSPDATGGSAGTTATPTKPATTGGTHPATSTTTTKPKRRAIVPAASPSLYVFINSVGGEGIFDRLRANFNIRDGYGLDRIADLANGEFAGYATGRTWKPADSATVYLELWQKINGVSYNYWIEQSQTKALHGSSLPADINSSAPSWANLSLYQLAPMSRTTQQLIQAFYSAHYTL